MLVAGIVVRGMALRIGGENGSNSSGFKPKLRAQTTNSAGKGVPGRGSGFAARKRRRR